MWYFVMMLLFILTYNWRDGVIFYLAERHFFFQGKLFWHPAMLWGIVSNDVLIPRTALKAVVVIGVMAWFFIIKNQNTWVYLKSSFTGFSWHFVLEPSPKIFLDILSFSFPFYIMHMTYLLFNLFLPFIFNLMFWCLINDLLGYLFLLRLFFKKV